MSLHDELFADAAAVLLEFQGDLVGSPAALSIFLRAEDQAPLRVDAIAGATAIDRNDGRFGGIEEREQVETVTVKVSSRDGAGLTWQPLYAMKVQRGADPVRWSVESIGGVGTALYTLKLYRRYVVDVGRAGRERGGR